MDLTAENVDTIIKDCLFTDEEVVDLSLHGVDSNDTEALAEAGHAVIVAGVVRSFGFHPERLEKHRDDVKSMLAQLPEEFREDKGGGMSFLNAVVRADGEQWGEHMNVDALFTMAVGLKLATYMLPREMWSAFPGGMPYISVHKP